MGAQQAYRANLETARALSPLPRSADVCKSQAPFSGICFNRVLASASLGGVGTVVDGSCLQNAESQSGSPGRSQIPFTFLPRGGAVRGGRQNSDFATVRGMLG